MKPTSNSINLFKGNEAEINRVINCLQTGVILQGPKAEILFSNKAALLMLGLTEDELTGRTSFHPDWNVIYEDGSPFPGSAHPVPMAIETKKTVSNVIMGVYRPVTGDRVWLQVTAEPLLDDTGEILEVICSFNDITERKAAEEKLNWLYQSLEIRAYELATSNADLERFLYVATHDLQEPLRMVSSFTQLLKKNYEHQLDEKANEYINYAVEGATRMKKLILDLLEYSKISSDSAEFSPTDMNVIVQDMAGFFSKELKDSEATFIAGDLPVIQSNPLLIGQLLKNLISNALKYRSSEKPVIEIGCEEEDDIFIFSIRDNGIGIDPRYSDTIFKLFRRLHNDNGNYEGTGVGLAICKKITELHRGTIWVEAAIGGGSAFYFTVSRNQNPAYEKL